MIINSSSPKNKIKSQLSELEVKDEFIFASIRYKPEDESEHKTDRYGYTQTKLQSLMELGNLSEGEVAQVKEFVYDTIAKETIRATRRKSIREIIEEKLVEEIEA